MKCVIGGARVRVFGRALHAIARISDEFWIDPKENGAILPLFRCLHTLERNVEKCNIYIDSNDCHIVFKLFCKHGVVKTHNLAFQESEPLQAIFAKHLCTNVLKVQSRQLSDMLIHFPSFQDEITLAVTPMKICFKTYSEDEVDFTKATHTEILLSPEEFEYFQGLLVFAEAFGAPVSIHFDVSGKPVAFSVEDMTIEAMFVLATLSNTGSWTTACKPTCLAQGQGQSRSPVLGRRNQDLIRCSRNTSTTPLEGFSMGEEGAPPDPSYKKFHSLFFGAGSPNEPSAPHLLHSLATSDPEEDWANGQLSPTF